MASAIDKRDTIPIPQPRGYPIVGNIADLDPETPTQSLENLAKQYGEIFSLTLFGKKRIFVASQRLVNEICDEKRFGKAVAAGVRELRHGIGDGLFTAFNEEENWAIAHRVLIPAFGPLNITGMFDDMKDIASQLVLKWARYGPEYVIPTTDDITRLTLDTLALCAMDYRFNSFYKDEMHPFVSCMTDFLKLSGMRARRPAYMESFYKTENKQYSADIDYMRSLANEIVSFRVQHPEEKKDLLNAMIQGVDKQTGKKMSNDVIINNMITFLIAGHETTSGLLSFLFYFLLKNPEAYRKAREEVDSVIGKGSIEPHHLSELPYITACLRETLRLEPTAPGFSIGTKSGQGEIIGGKYFIEHGVSMLAVLPAAQRDPAVYPDDPDEFKPERMLDESFNKLPPNSWKPFGNGSRACIGRPFAWQEAMMVTAMVLQYFDLSLQDPQYTLQIKSTLTIKPKDFSMRATLREGWSSATEVEQSLSGSIRCSGPKKGDPAAAVEAKSDGVPFTVLYGSNAGTCESFANTLAADAGAHGFKATVQTLDSARQSLPSKEPIVVVTASYEGQPPDNAAHFYEWLQTLKEDEKLETAFAVYGCGHSDWKQTFQKIPNSINQLLEVHGGKRICPKGETDAAKGNMLSEFQSWEDEIFWPAMKKQYGGEDASSAPEAASAGQSLTIEVSNKRKSILRADVSEAKVVAAKTLTAPGVPEKRHIELQLPTEMSYRAGDYLAVLPLNPAPTVHRILTRFGLPWDAMLSISSKTGTTLPTDHPVSAHNLFSAFVELGQPATKRNVSMLIEASKGETKAELKKLLDGDFNAEVVEKRVSLLDLLEKHPDIELPLSAFVASLIPMRVRQYSISSSPLANPHNVTLTYAVVEGDSMSGQGRHIGVASTYLSQLDPGDITHVALKPSHQAFHLPTDNEKTPVIMVCAGTGLAPMRGFVQERAAQIGAGRKLAPAHLYVGSRHPDKDELYHEEFTAWEKMGAVTIHHAFSQAPELSNGHKHVDDALLADEAMLMDLWEQGAKIYVCGSRELGESVKQATVTMAKHLAKAHNKPGTDEDAEAWFENIKNERYSTDVFA